jgi:ribosomal protein L35AE/L33A
MWRKADSDIPNELQDIISRKFSESSKEGDEGEGTISHTHEQRGRVLAAHVRALDSRQISAHLTDGNVHENTNSDQFPIPS